MRNFLIAMVSVLGLLVAAPAVADVVGTEKQLKTDLACPQGQAVPASQEAPENGECKDNPATPDVDESKGVYTGYVWTNEVTCDSDNQDAGGVLSLDAEQDGTGGEMGLCSDGALPIHG